MNSSGKISSSVIGTTPEISALLGFRVAKNRIILYPEQVREQ
jgi:hypothetical protein